MSYISPRVLHKSQSKKETNIFTIIFNRIEPLGYHVLDYFVRLEMRGQSWESPIIQGGEYQQSVVKTSLRKQSKVHEQEKRKSNRLKKWVVQVRGGQQISGVLKFIEKKQDSQRFKGKAKIEIKNQGTYELYIFDQSQLRSKQKINTKSSIIFRKESQNGQKPQGKRIAYIQYQVLLNNQAKKTQKSQKTQSQVPLSSRKSQYSNIFQLIPKQLEKKEQQIKTPKNSKIKEYQGQQQRIQFNFPISEQASMISHQQAKNLSHQAKDYLNFQGSFIEKVDDKNSEISQNEQHDHSIVNKLIKLNQSMDKELQYRKDEQEAFSRMVEQDSLFIQTLKGVNGKSSGRLIEVQEAKKIISPSLIKNSLKFKGRRTKYSENPEKMYDGKNVSQQKQTQFQLSRSNKNSSQSNSLGSQTKFGKSAKQQTIKYMATLYNFNIQCDAKPKGLQIYELNTKNCQERILLKVKSKNQCQFTWDNQIKIEQNQSQHIELRAKINGAKGQTFEGNIFLKDKDNCAILQKINNKEVQIREIALLRYRKKTSKLLQTKYHQLIQMPDKEGLKQEKNKARNKIGKIQELQQQSEENSENFVRKLSLNQQQKGEDDFQQAQSSTNYKELQSNKHEEAKQSQRLRQNVVAQKINQVKSMFMPKNRKQSHNSRIQNANLKLMTKQVIKEVQQATKLAQSLNFDKQFKPNQNQKNSSRRNIKNEEQKDANQRMIKNEKQKNDNQLNINNHKQKYANQISLKNEKQQDAYKSHQQQISKRYKASKKNQQQTSKLNKRLETPKLQQKRSRQSNFILNAKQKWVKQQEDLGESQVGLTSEPSSPNRFSRNSENQTRNVQEGNKDRISLHTIQKDIQVDLAPSGRIQKTEFQDSKYQVVTNSIEKQKKVYQEGLNQFRRSLTDNVQISIPQKSRFSTLNTHRVTQMQIRVPESHEYAKEKQMQFVKRQNNFQIEQSPATNKKLTMVNRTVHDNIIPQQIYNYYLSKKQKDKKVSKRNQSNASSKASKNSKQSQSQTKQRSIKKVSNTSQVNLPTIIHPIKQETNRLETGLLIPPKNNLINVNKFSESGATISKRPKIFSPPIDKYSTSNYQDRGEKIRLKTLQVDNSPSQTQILIHLINIDLHYSNPLTGKYITMEVYPNQPYRTETLTCNKRLIWRGKGYSFKVFTSDLAYENECSLVIKLFEEVPNSTTLIGKLIIPLGLLVDSGEVYQGRIHALDLEVLGDILLEFKIFNHIDPKNLQRRVNLQLKKQKLKTKEHLLQSDIQQIGKISRKIQQIYDKYNTTKKRSRTLPKNVGKQKSDSSVSPIAKKQLMPSRVILSNERLKRSLRTQKSKDYSPQKLNEYFNDPSFVEKLLQLKRKCKHLSHANCKSCSNEQNQRNIIRSHKKNFKVKRISKIDQDNRQTRDLAKQNPKIQILKKSKKYLYEE